MAYEKFKREPKLRHHRYTGDSLNIETWWHGVRSDSLAPVLMPIGLEASIVSVFRHLPGKKQRAEQEFIRLLDS
jgi:hypothetical protein